jgi:hypothetical protein
VLFVLHMFQTSQPGLEVFQNLLEQNPHILYPARTSKALLMHWQLMKQYHLLPDQTGNALGQNHCNHLWKYNFQHLFTFIHDCPCGCH